LQLCSNLTLHLFRVYSSFLLWLSSCSIRCRLNWTLFICLTGTLRHTEGGFLCWLICCLHKCRGFLHTYKSVLKCWERRVGESVWMRLSVNAWVLGDCGRNTRLISCLRFFCVSSLSAVYLWNELFMTCPYLVLMLMKAHLYNPRPQMFRW